MFYYYEFMELIREYKLIISINNTFILYLRVIYIFLLEELIFILLFGVFKNKKIKTFDVF